jgi:hypothetical protein
MSLEPNPASTAIEVGGLLNGSLSTLTLRDLTGKIIEVVQTTAASASFDLSKLCNGTYLIELSTLFGTQQQKFVKL